MSTHEAAWLRTTARTVSAFGLTVRRHWFAIAAGLVGLYAGLPWLAPVLMRLGWVAPAHAIYALYSTQCHQMAQRSYFLFGPALMHSPSDLLSAGVLFEPAALRAFLGNAELGWKVAWSDRMTSMYTSLFVSMLGIRVFGGRLRRLPTWAFAMMLLPLALDGATHLISDFSGLGLGFRDTNAWLAALTANRLPSAFYVGDAWGSFNAGMRLVTGALFGLAIAWYVLPGLEAIIQALPLRPFDGRPGTTPLPDPALGRARPGESGAGRGGLRPGPRQG